MQILKFRKNEKQSRPIYFHRPMFFLSKKKKIFILLFYTFIGKFNKYFIFYARGLLSRYYIYLKNHKQNLLCSLLCIRLDNNLEQRNGCFYVKINVESQIRFFFLFFRPVLTWSWRMNDRIAMNIKLTRKSTDKLFDRFLFYSLFFFSLFFSFFFTSLN